MNNFSGNNENFPVFSYLSKITNIEIKKSPFKETADNIQDFNCDSGFQKIDNFDLLKFTRLKKEDEFLRLKLEKNSGLTLENLTERIKRKMKYPFIFPQAESINNKIIFENQFKNKLLKDVNFALKSPHSKTKENMWERKFSPELKDINRDSPISKHNLKDSALLKNIKNYPKKCSPIGIYHCGNECLTYRDTSSRNINQESMKKVGRKLNDKRIFTMLPSNKNIESIKNEEVRLK